jgi:hypothetical protein
MKKLLLLVAVMSFSISAFASHAYGGEITWKCLKSGSNAGKFVFYMSFYRDCGGISGPPSTIYLSSNGPVASIQMDLVVTPGQANPRDVSPVCYLAPNSPIRCATAGNTQGTGAIEEFKYQSQPITLNGVPPIAGWVFDWSLNARPTLTNVNGGGNLYLRAIMFPYQVNGVSQNTSQCFDSSPRFLEPPKSVICIGKEFDYVHFAFDDDIDSTRFDLTPAMYSASSPVTYQPGYSALNPVPVGSGTMTFNNQTGTMTFTPTAIGSFITATKITSYRCGQRISEVYRDIPIAIRSDCDIIGSPVNLPPTVAFTPVGSQPLQIVPIVSGNDTTHWEATVFAGQQVQFKVVAQDPQLLPNFTMQTISLQAFGGQLGNPLSNSTTGCDAPPCATIAPVAPQSSLSNTLNNEALFNWQTSCNHVSNLGLQCGSPSTRYNFNLRMQDNFCPIPAYRSRTVVVNVVSTIAVPPDMTNACASVNANGTVSINWGFPVDTGMNFDSYVIYHSASPTAPFTVLDTLFNYNQLSYTHNSPGPGANYYFIRSKGGCESLSISSDTLKSSGIMIQPQNFIAYSGTGWANFICTSSDTAATYQWQQNIGSGWSNLSNFGNYSGVTSDSLVITGVTSSMNNYGYRCIVASCTTDTSDVAVLTVTNGIGLVESKLDKLTVSPNPTNGFISLNAVVLGTYELLTLDGRIFESGTAMKEYDLSVYPNGVYNLRITTDEGSRVLKVVKN